MKHSPGPWRWCRPSGLGRYEEGTSELVAADDNTVCSFDDECPFMPEKADAALIAAAPEMLALVREIAYGDRDVTLDARALIARVDG